MAASNIGELLSQIAQAVDGQIDIQIVVGNGGARRAVKHCIAQPLGRKAEVCDKMLTLMLEGLLRDVKKEG